MNEKKPITIGVLAKAANVGVETIRFYQRKAIIEQPPKTNGFRHYSNEDIRIVRLVKKLQGVGFSLDEIKDFVRNLAEFGIEVTPKFDRYMKYTTY